MTQPMRLIRDHAALLLIGTALTAGCSSPGKVSAENDRLREENMDLAEKIAEVNRLIEEVSTKLDAAERRLRGEIPQLPEDARRPACTSIEIGAFSGGYDTDGDKSDDSVRVYLSTLDGRNRFVQTVATAKMTVAAVPPGKQAQTIGTANFTTKQFDEAYRSGVAGTHYTLNCAATAVPDGLENVTVSVSVTDLLTGETHKTEKVVRWTAK